MTLAQSQHDLQNPLLQSLESLFKKTKKKHWKKKTFAHDLAGLQIPGFTTELAHLLSLEIQGHLKENNSRRTKDHLIELIEERLFDWGIITGPISQKKETPKACVSNTLDPELLEKLHLIRHQEKIENLIVAPHQTNEKVHFENETRTHWQKLLQISFDEAPEIKLKTIARELALNERIYQPNCSLPEWQNKFFEMLCHPAIILSPYLLNNLTRPEFMSEQITLPPPQTTEDGFETLKLLAGYLPHKIPLGINLSELPPSSDNMDSASLSGEVIPFLHTLLNSSLTHSLEPLLRVTLNINHPDIMTFLDLIPRMVLQNIKPTLLLDNYFLNALFRYENWVPVFQNKKGHSLNVNTITEKLLHCLIDYGFPEILTLPAKSVPLGQQTPAYYGGILTHSHSNYLTAHLNIADYGIQTSNYWDELRSMLELSCHLLDNAMLASKATHARHYIFNLYGLEEWISQQGIEISSKKATDKISRLFDFINTELTKQAEKMGKKRGHQNLNPLRFNFSLATYQNQAVSEIFEVNAGMPQQQLENMTHHEGLLEIKYKGVSNPREILKIFKLIPPNASFLFSFIK